MKKFLLVFLLLFASGCAPSPALTPDMDAPVSSDATPAPSAEPPPGSTRGNVFFDSIELLTMESFPLQFALTLRGDLPTPCHRLQIEMSPPDAENKILLDVYSVSDPSEMCAQVLQPFEENFPLGSFPAGHYFLWVNGELVTEFDA